MPRRLLALSRQQPEALAEQALCRAALAQLPVARAQLELGLLRPESLQPARNSVRAKSESLPAWPGFQRHTIQAGRQRVAELRDGRLPLPVWARCPPFL